MLKNSLAPALPHHWFTLICTFPTHTTSPQKDPSISSRILLAGLGSTVGFVGRRISVALQCEASNSNNSKRAVVTTSRSKANPNQQQDFRTKPPKKSNLQLTIFVCNRK